MFRWFVILPYLVLQVALTCPLIVSLNGLLKVKPFKCLAMVHSPVILLMWMISLNGTVAAIQDVGYEIINLGGGRNPVSLNTIIEKLEILIGKKAVH